MADFPAVEGLDPDTADRADGPSAGGLPSTVRNHLGLQLQAAYAASMEPGMPQRFVDLIEQLEQVLGARDRDSADVFRRGLIEALPGLRVFAMSIIPDASRVDDLVQETVLRAWAKQDLFVPGTNLKAWLCTILRNHFYTEYRKRKREVEDADGAAAAELIAPASQEHTSELRALWARIAKLPASQREALLLVGAEGLTYEAAAEVMGCGTGTVKSRVSRARAALADGLA